MTAYSIFTNKNLSYKQKKWEGERSKRTTSIRTVDQCHFQLGEVGMELEYDLNCWS